MAEFINTIDVLGEDAVIDSIIDRSITEFKDDTLEKVGSYAFYGCTALAVVDLPNAVTIAYSGFYGCTALNSVNIPAVTSIDAYNTFSNCKALKEITLPSCINIGQGAFSYCYALEEIHCNASDKLTIGNNAFSYCPLKALVLRSNSVATLSSINALSDTGVAKGSGYIYVPRTLVDGYKAASNWSNYANQFRAIEDYPEITGG